MELGSVQWSRDPQSLIVVCDFVLTKIAKTDRILTLRCLKPEEIINHSYELLEIPTAIFPKVYEGQFTISPRSQQSPPVGRSVVKDGLGTMFEFYFDGGTEMKLQLKSLRKDLCVTHATWQFATKIGAAAQDDAPQED